MKLHLGKGLLYIISFSVWLPKYLIQNHYWLRNIICTKIKIYSKETTKTKSLKFFLLQRSNTVWLCCFIQTFQNVKINDVKIKSVKNLFCLKLPNSLRKSNTFNFYIFDFYILKCQSKGTQPLIHNFRCQNSLNFCKCYTILPYISCCPVVLTEELSRNKKKLFFKSIS